MPGAREIGMMGAALALTGGVACAFCYLMHQTQQQQPKKKVKDEKKEHVHKATKTETAQKTPIISEPRTAGTQVLVLGLDGAGKTSLLHCFATGSLEQDVCPTQGFNAVSINKEELQIEFLEIGGTEKLRDYWRMYLGKARVMVFVVDSSDPERFPLAKRLLHQLLSADPCLPLVLLANKQDVPGARGVTDLYEALDLGTVGDGHRLSVIGTQVKKGKCVANTGVQDARDIIIDMMADN
ncbi:ADP-ribosylation factor-like protein 9 [Pimephales promelas]|uniref:ADP-ribosylation factor-like protein 9 n=1 Tax=Pimephales promelas TaxID=90988 RepID=UPI0019557E37|nr:ADP-ribosylation factor-like protein 9 [Pimephales promelas]KAG1934565.1 ADP-ribosylation factor-like protein [Pimephales promelas]